MNERKNSGIAATFAAVVKRRQPVERLTFIRHQTFAPWPRRADSRAVGGAARHCMAFRSACELGWYLYPPFNADVRWQGDREFAVQVDADTELEERLWAASMQARTGWASTWWCSKIAGVFQVDPGLTFVTRPGEKLLLTGPFNRLPEGYFPQSGVLDSDWFWVPTTINFQFLEADRWVRFSRDVPFAQIVRLGTSTFSGEEAIQTSIEEFPEVHELTMLYQTHKYGPVEEWHGCLPEVPPGSYARLQRSLRDVSSRQVHDRKGV